MDSEKQIEITEKAVRKDKEDGMVDLLNQEVEELSKEKKIEEIEEIESIINIFLFDFGMRGVASALYEKGYRKINENEVVISKEEVLHTPKKQEKNYQNL